MAFSIVWLKGRGGEKSGGVHKFSLLLLQNTISPNQKENWSEKQKKYLDKTAPTSVSGFFFFFYFSFLTLACSFFFLFYFISFDFSFVTLAFCFLFLYSSVLSGGGFFFFSFFFFLNFYFYYFFKKTIFKDFLCYFLKYPLSSIHNFF